jgi:transcriptional regulator with XRE-family HTH domain
VPDNPSAIQPHKQSCGEWETIDRCGLQRLLLYDTSEMAPKLLLPPNQTAGMLAERMRGLNLSIRDVAGKVGTSYEHVRSVVAGNALPSDIMALALAGALKIKKEELERVLTADRIRKKFGTIPLEIAGKNPELEPLERVWKYLSQDHKADLIAQAKAWAIRDQSVVIIKRKKSQKLVASSEL